jgi:hypothetical protein
MAVYIIPGFFRKKKFYQPLAKSLQQAGLQAEIIDLGINVCSLKYAAQVVLRYLKKTDEKVDIIAHSFGGLIVKQALITDPGITPQIKSISFVAVPHRGSWSTLLVPIWPATINMMPFTKELKNTAMAILPDKTMNFVPETEIKIWPDKFSLLNNHTDTVISSTNHDSILFSQDFTNRVIEFVKSSS